MRILYLNHNVAGSGTYQRAINFAAVLAGRGHDVTLVTTSRRRRGSGLEGRVRGVRVIESPDLLVGGARNGWDPWNTGWRIRHLSGEHFDLIHAFDCRPAVIGPALAQQRSTGAPLFIDWADWWGRGGTIVERSGWAVRTFFGPVETWFEEAFRTRAAANTTISEALRDRCVALGVDVQRTRVLPNGCLPPVEVPGGRTAARTRCGIGDEPLIVHLGTVHRGDAAMLFDALRVVRHAQPGVTVAFLGHFSVPVPADLADNVRLTGYVHDADLQDWLAAADTAVIPLRDTVANRARWPGKVNEYLSAALPVVMTRVGAAAQVVADAGAGVACSANAAALAEALINLLQDPDSRARMADAARGLAAGELAWERIGSELAGFYARWGVAGEAAAGIRASGVA